MSSIISGICQRKRNRRHFSQPHNHVLTMSSSYSENSCQKKVSKNKRNAEEQNNAVQISFLTSNLHHMLCIFSNLDSSITRCLLHKLTFGKTIEEQRVLRIGKLTIPKFLIRKIYCPNCPNYIIVEEADICFLYKNMREPGIFKTVLTLPWHHLLDPCLH